MESGTRCPNTVLMVCTGNAARSVMAGVALARLRQDLVVETAGTLTVDGLPISWRTRAALDAVGLPWPRHASKQVTSGHLRAADLVIAMAPEHVEWIRRNEPGAAARTATLVDLVRRLPRGPAELRGRVAEMGLGTWTLQADEEIVDPGGGEVDAFIAAARQIVALIGEIAPDL